MEWSERPFLFRWRYKLRCIWGIILDRQVAYRIHVDAERGIVIDEEKGSYIGCRLENLPTAYTVSPHLLGPNVFRGPDS